MILDDYAAELFSKNINMMVPYYLMASYAYYVEDDPIFSDAFYDNLAKTILAVWDSIEHRHKHILNTDMLEAGSFMGEYPSIISGALESLRKNIGKNK
mgnify:FL=1|jgi:hypothetical protein